MRKGRHLFLLPPMAAALSGCMASGWVSSIGAREQYGYIDPAAGQVVVFDAPLRHVSVGGCQARLLPYTGYCRAGEGQWLGRFEYQPAPGGVLVALPGGGSAFRQGGNLVQHRYRRWYGYPAQALQVVAVPADVAVDTVFASLVVAFAAVAIGPPPNHSSPPPAASSVKLK